VRQLRPVAVASVAAVLGLGAPHARAVPPAVLATAGFGLVGNAEHGYLATFTVRSGFATGAPATQELVYEVHTCQFDSLECQLSSQHVTALGDGAFVVRPDGTATLRTRWAGKPLIVRWVKGGGGRFPTSSPTVAYVFTNHEEVLTGGVTALNARAVATSILGGSRGCLDGLAVTLRGQVGVSQDVLARTSNTPVAEAVPGLLAGRGRCYSEAKQPKSVRFLRTRTIAASS
jgi:hypothetical protein